MNLDQWDRVVAERAHIGDHEAWHQSQTPGNQSMQLHAFEGFGAYSDEFFDRDVDHDVGDDFSLQFTEPVQRIVARQGMNVVFESLTRASIEKKTNYVTQYLDRRDELVRTVMTVYHSKFNEVCRENNERDRVVMAQHLCKSLGLPEVDFWIHLFLNFFAGVASSRKVNQALEKKVKLDIQQAALTTFSSPNTDGGLLYLREVLPLKDCPNGSDNIARNLLTLVAMATSFYESSREALHNQYRQIRYQGPSE